MHLARRHLVACIALGLGTPACRDFRDNPTTSDTTETGDETTTGSEGTTSCPIGMDGCACTGGGACDPGLVCNDAQICVPAPDPSDASTSGSESNSSGDTTTTGGTDTGTDSDSTTGDDLECNTPGSPEESMECTKLDPKRPFCGADNVCAACVDNAQCELGTNGARPLCQTGGMMAGACVECNAIDALAEEQCPPEAPHCSQETFTCEGCLEHSECPTTACEIETRKCFPEDRVLYVRKGPTMANPCTYDVPQGGFPANPYCDMQPALDHAKFAGVTTGWTFVLMSSDSSEDHGAFTVSGGDVPIAYAVTHQYGSPLNKHTKFTALGPVITVDNKVTLYLVDFGVHVKPNAFADSHFGIDCVPGGALWLDDSSVLYSRGPGVRAEDCEVHMRRSAIAFGRTEGIELIGGSLHMVDSFINENGSTDDLGGGAIHMSNGAVAEIVYSTLANNVNEPQTGGDILDCEGPATVKIRNSVFARGANTGNASVVCPEADVMVTNSVVDGDFGTDNGNNKIAAEDILDALEPDIVTGAYRLNSPVTAMSFQDVPLWQSGDPVDDFERQARLRDPPEAHDYAGADYYVP